MMHDAKRMVKICMAVLVIAHLEHGPTLASVPFRSQSKNDRTAHEGQTSPMFQSQSNQTLATLTTSAVYSLHVASLLRNNISWNVSITTEELI